jgi:hypothetical protein
MLLLVGIGGTADMAAISSTRLPTGRSRRSESADQAGPSLVFPSAIETPAATFHRDEDVTRACGSFLGVVGVFCFSVFFFCDSRPLFAFQCLF